jgi:pyruvate/2-oxoglutarate dehydrogenase complex dihydrolipoamide dehydrogenase (E3) component
VIERKYIGGSCSNIACLPSKNIIHSAKVTSYVRRSREFGIVNGHFTVDMRAVCDRKRRMVSGWNDGTTRQLRGKNVIVNTGTHAAFESIPGLVEAQPLTHIEALELDVVGFTSKCLTATCR